MPDEFELAHPGQDGSSGEMPGEYGMAGVETDAGFQVRRVAAFGDEGIKSFEHVFSVYFPQSKQESATGRFVRLFRNR